MLEGGIFKSQVSQKTGGVLRLKESQDFKTRNSQASARGQGRSSGVQRKIWRWSSRGWNCCSVATAISSLAISFQFFCCHTYHLSLTRTQVTPPCHPYRPPPCAPFPGWTIAPVASTLQPPLTALTTISPFINFQVSNLFQILFVIFWFYFKFSMFFFDFYSIFIFPFLFLLQSTLLPTGFL